jgi:hypothetical protein
MARTTQLRKETMAAHSVKFTFCSIAIVGFVFATVTSLSAKKKDRSVEAGMTPLMVATSQCNTDDVNALLGQAADVKAVDKTGRDALTYASLQRTKHLTLKCPGVVLALIKAGADPQAARFYQSSELTHHMPNNTAVLRVEDSRPSKEQEISVEELVDGVEGALSQARPRVSEQTFAAGVAVRSVGGAHYPIMRLGEAQEKMKAAGFSAEEIAHPDLKRACSVLGTDAVFEAVLMDYAHTSKGSQVTHVGIKGTGAVFEFRLTDCRTGQLLWKNGPWAVGEARGIFLRGMNSFRILSEMSLSLPRYGTKD